MQKMLLKTFTTFLENDILSSETFLYICLALRSTICGQNMQQHKQILMRKIRVQN